MKLLVVGCAASALLACLEFGSPAAHAQEAAPEAPSAEEAKPNDKASVTERAREHFERGVDYYGEGDYRAALIEFQRAYSIQPTYRLLYNLGQVAYELRDYAGAERYFRGYLVEGEDELTPERRAEVKEELERLKGRVSSLRIHTNQKNAEVHVDDRLIGEAEAGAIRVSAGRRQIVAEKPGFAPVRRTVDVLGGEEVKVDLIFGPPLAGAGSAPVASQSSSNVLPWITGITSGVLLVGSAAFGYWAYSDSSNYSEQLQHYTTQSELDRLSSQTRTKALVADVLLGTGIAAAVATAIIVLNGSSSDTAPPSAAKASLKLHPTGLQLKF